MIVHLDADVFEVVKTGTKKIEVRVYDEKRRQLKKGDHLTFIKRPNDSEKINTIVDDLVCYKNFEDLVSDYTMEDLYIKDYSKDAFLNLLKKFYSEDEINKYGVIAIKFHII